MGNLSSNYENNFTFPTRYEKVNKLCNIKRNSKEYELIIFKSQEYSELQALILYYFAQKYEELIDVFLPSFFIKDVIDKNKNLSISRRYFQIIWKCNGKGGGNLTFPSSNFWDNIIQFKNKSTKRFFIISLHFWSCPRQNGGHANLLVYDRFSNIFERFEPNGLCASNNEWYDSEAFDNEFNEYCEKYDILYLSPKKLNMPKKSWQKLQIEQEDDKKTSLNFKSSLEKEEYFLNQGFCSIWCMVFLESKISNPDIHPANIIEQVSSILDKNKIDYIFFIKYYTINLIIRVCELLK